MPDPTEHTYYNVTFAFNKDDALRVKMYYRDVTYVEEAINNGSEWFVFPDKDGDTYYVHLKYVRVIRKENPNKAF